MLNISKQIYSGWNTTNQKLELPEAEVIPFGESANEKRKLSNVTKKYPVLKEYDNFPLPGFTLFKVNKKTWSSADQSWLVIDPRGFLVRISNENLEDILYVTGVTEGLIQEKCVWAREDSQTRMTLVPVSSEKYKEAVKNTELLDSKVSIKDVQIGDTVLLQNKLQGKFMGVLSLYGSLEGYSLERKPQVFLRRQIIEIEDGKYHYQADAKILKVIEKSDKLITREESAKLINEKIEGGNTFFTTSTDIKGRYYSTRGMIKFVSIHAVPKLPMSFVEITNLEATAIFHDSLLISDCGRLLLEDVKGKFSLVDYPYNFIAGSSNINQFQISNIDTLDKELLKLKPDSNGFYSRTRELHKLDNFAKFYKIVKHVKNDSYV